jgi:hypothetical protein
MSNVRNCISFEIQLQGHCNSGSEITPRAAKFIGANFCFVIAAVLGFGLVRSVIFWNMALDVMGLLLIALLV